MVTHGFAAHDVHRAHITSKYENLYGSCTGEMVLNDDKVCTMIYMVKFEK